MTDENKFRIEAAIQLGFEEAVVHCGKTEVYSCTESQLIAFAKHCEQKAKSEAARLARIRAEQFGTLTTSFQELRALATDLESGE